VVPWRMVGFLLVLGLLAGFAALNAEHRADISFGFFAFVAVPVFLSLLLAFIVGALFVLPLALRRGKRMRDAELADAPTEEQVRAALSDRPQRRLLGLGGRAAVEVDPAEKEAGVSVDESALAENPSAGADAARRRVLDAPKPTKRSPRSKSKKGPA